MMWARLLCLSLLLIPAMAVAQTGSDFTVQIFGNTDNTPPSSPVVTSVLPVTSNQIDVTWSSSTDNFLVAGYVVFRDGVAIATTTAISFVDIDLTASTTYTYQIAAFDGLPNYSPLSAGVATTTLENIIPANNQTNQNQATRARVVLEGVSVIPATAAATLEIDTRNNARIEVRIGESSSYELLTVVGSVFTQAHTVVVNDLRPAMTYYYQIIGYTPSGGQSILESGSFVTQSDSPPAAPTNVTGLTAEVIDRSVRLGYQLPVDFPDNGRVRIVRNHLYFPTAINDGVVVYEGRAEAAIDQNVFSDYQQAFYTVFVIDPAGFVSSGAIASAAFASDELDINLPTVPLLQPTAPDVQTDLSASTSESSAVVDDTSFPEQSDFVISQANALYEFSDDRIELSAQQTFEISVAEDLVQGDFKTMVVTMTNPQDQQQSFSFLLRLTGDQSRYSATIAPLGTSGRSDITVQVFDYDTRIVQSYATVVHFTNADPAVSKTLGWNWNTQTWLLLTLVSAPVLASLLLWYVMWRREHQDEDNGS